MPRPSLAAQRTEEILDALELCILEDSLETTSLERLAEKARMKRSILRHYIGNRDDIICALSERYRGYYSEQWQQTLAWLPSTNRVEAMLDILFGARDQAYINKSIVGEAIYGQAKRLPVVHKHQQASTEEFIQIVTEELTRAYPNADAKRITLVAHNILSNYLNSESLLPLGLAEEINTLKAASILLLELLGVESS